MINIDKCIFGVESLEFLGFNVSPRGVVPPTQKVEIIKHFPLPKTTKSLQEFNGMINYYHRFIPQASQIMQPLYQAIKNTKNIEWTKEMTSSFEKTKEALAHATMLTYPKMNTPIALTCDASGIAV